MMSTWFPLFDITSSIEKNNHFILCNYDLRSDKCYLLWQKSFFFQSTWKNIFSCQRSIFQTFWKVYCCARFLFLRLQILATCLFSNFFNFAKLQKDWIYTRRFIKVPPLNSNIMFAQSFWNFAQLKKIKK